MGRMRDCCVWRISRLCVLPNRYHSGLSSCRTSLLWRIFIMEEQLLPRFLLLVDFGNVSALISVQPAWCRSRAPALHHFSLW